MLNDEIKNFDYNCHKFHKNATHSLQDPSSTMKKNENDKNALRGL